MYSHDYFQLLERHNLTDLPVPNQWKWVTKQPAKKRKIPTPSPHPTPTPDNASTPVPSNETPKEGNTPDIMKFAVPGMSPKFPAKDIKELKENKTVAPVAKDANAASILKFAKPGITPNFPVISPKPMKPSGQPSPMCSTPKTSVDSGLVGGAVSSNTPVASNGADTPKRQPNKQISRSSLFSAAVDSSVQPRDTSINENDDNDCVVMKMELLKPDKNQPTMKQMLGKKPAVASVKKRKAPSKKTTPVARKKSAPVAKEADASVVKTVAATKSPGGGGVSVAKVAAKLKAFAAGPKEDDAGKPSGTSQEKDAAGQVGKDIKESEKNDGATKAKIGKGTEECPMEID